MVKKADASILAGVGLDGDDGHQRLTKGDNFLLVGGCEETHEVMKETAIKFGEKLAARGKTVGELSPDEFRDLIREASPRQ